MKANKNHIIIGAILIILGMIFLFDLDFGDLIGIIWALALIGVGLYILSRYRKQNASDNGASGVEQSQSGIPGVFGDIKVAGLTEGIGSIERTLVFGDILIDLTDSKLIQGKNHISANVLFGDITIKVPDDFSIGVNLGCCAGDILFKDKRSDGFLAGVKYKDDNYENASAKLFINAKSCFGDIKVISISK